MDAEPFDEFLAGVIARERASRGEHPPRREQKAAMTAARTRRYRLRRRNGISVLKIVCDLPSVSAALIDSGRLSIASSIERAKVEQAIGEVVHEWASRWR